MVVFAAHFKRKVHSMTQYFSGLPGMFVFFDVRSCSNIDSKVLIVEQLGSNYMATTPV